VVSAAGSKLLLALTAEHHNLFLAQNSTGNKNKTKWLMTQSLTILTISGTLNVTNLFNKFKHSEKNNLHVIHKTVYTDIM